MTDARKGGVLNLAGRIDVEAAEATTAVLSANVVALETLMEAAIAARLGRSRRLAAL